MKKIKLYYEKFIGLLERFDTYLQNHRWLRFFIIMLYDLFYLFVIIETLSWSMDLLTQSLDAFNIITVVLAFHIINVVLTPALYKE